MSVIRGVGLKWMSAGLASAAIAAIALGSIDTARAADPRAELFQKFQTAVKGKTVAWVPVWLGVLESEWTRVMKAHFDDYGIKLIVRDPNFKSDVQLQAVSSLINEKPDILVVQNPTTTLLARELKRAMDSGIKVIQVNMASNQLTDAYVGADVPKLGRVLAEEVVKTCGGGKGSGKVAILQGEATAAYSLDMTKAATEIFNGDKSIKVVSSQPTNWDANKAADVTTNVLQQNPDLCGIFSVWGPQTAGAAQVVKNAGKQGQVKIFVASDGQPADCDMVEQGLFTKNLSYRADTQGEAIVNAVLTLLQDSRPAGTTQLAYYTTNYWVSGKDDRHYCFVVPKE
ncbi:sugar ABC transporter substrate-binding protein [Bradyrhizobium septentrionale]|uniref:Sugar ABC transporter substrate-binding protein n=2 Tax=Bradyrhizobium septentrionale TaxID=1404411 RepID=A0ABZ2P236_9BRAD|nr:sugar ABC transporter substrate-binding protein [Bradyrhizobium septentrionale]UGY17684.1 sugar ABC transporter substrate-binding protein [Bradyrhizobium septentrionale]UGY26421.1 sugar ABC transporter substrate-binding protein [Bradyrhizobium septentrionale]